MNSVVIFDVSENQEATVRQLMAAKGYYLNWTSGEGADKKMVYLPHNVVWKPNTESQQAVDDIKQVIQTLNGNRATNPVSLLRCVVLNSTPWKAIFGVSV
jgi:hypothetical protein